MALSAVNADAGYFGIKDVVYAQRTGAKTYAAPIDIAYAKAKTYKRPTATKIEQRANTELLFSIPGTYTTSGKLSCAGREYALEKKLGTYYEGTDVGRVEVAPNAYIRGAVGYSCMTYNSSGQPVAIKVWEYNIEFNPQAEENFKGDQENPDLGTYEYDYAGYGEIAEESGVGTDDYEDANGCKVTMFRKISRFGDTDYASFLSAVPAPKMPA